MTTAEAMSAWCAVHLLYLTLRVRHQRLPLGFDVVWFARGNGEIAEHEAGYTAVFDNVFGAAHDHSGYTVSLKCCAAKLTDW